MAGQRGQNLLRSRRRTRDDAEDDTSVMNEAIDDSQSDASAPSDADADDDADYSDLSEPDLHRSAGAAKRLARHKMPPKHAISAGNSPTASFDAKLEPGSRSFHTISDTEAMMNGLKISDGESPLPAMDFDEAENEASQSAPESSKPIKLMALAEKRRMGHDEYKKKLETDPKFIPTRGNFFMHDERTAANQNGFRPYGRGRGRGRVAPAGPFPQATGPPQEPSNSKWSHDLHDTLLEPATKAGPPPPRRGPQANHPNVSLPKPQHNQPNTSVSKPPPPVRSFSTTQLVGKVQVRVSLPGMKSPICFSDVLVQKYTKLPYHRPPLRRDKPVRISLPNRPPRYIFPSVERSFIFIPRNLRPNQHGMGRGRGRGLGSIGGFSSRRTSIYNGSMYSPSIAMSRRSSIARDGMASPVGSIMSGRPIVRLPVGPHPNAVPAIPFQRPMSSAGTPAYGGTPTYGGTPVFGGPPAFNGPPAFTQPPQGPAYRENRQSSIQMHQPRPQKAISVTGIENPASAMNLPGSVSPEQQPFHHQLPQHMNGTSTPHDHYNQSHSRHQSYQAHPTVGTPLSNIPERAVHAQSFQPYPQSAYPPPTYNTHTPYYFQPPNAPAQYAPGAPMMSMYTQNPAHGAYMAPNPLNAAVAGASPPAPVQQVAAQQPMPSAAATTSTSSGMVAHEQNGMVYYYDPSMYVPPPPVAAPPPPPPQQQAPPPPPPDSYAPQPQQGYGVGMGGGMVGQPTDGAYYYHPHHHHQPVAAPGAVYYPPQ